MTRRADDKPYKEADLLAVRDVFERIKKLTPWQRSFLCYRVDQANLLEVTVQSLAALSPIFITSGRQLEQAAGQLAIFA
jgi:hypothetical protein